MKNLLSKTKNLDQECFEELFFQYHGRLVLFANKFVGDKQTAKDLVQDAFVNLWDRAEKTEIKQSAKAYLYQMVQNSCLNYRRHLGIKQTAEEHFKLKISEAEKQVFRNQDNPYISLLELELEEKIAETIDKLPKKCGEVFKLSRHENLKNKEIAERLGISVKMVEKHISRALAVLRYELADYLVLFLPFLIK